MVMCGRVYTCMRECAFVKYFPCSAFVCGLCYVWVHVYMYVCMGECVWVELDIETQFLSQSRIILMDV